MTSMTSTIDEWVSAVRERATASAVSLSRANKEGNPKTNRQLQAPRVSVTPLRYR